LQVISSEEEEAEMKRKGRTSVEHRGTVKKMQKEKTMKEDKIKINEIKRQEKRERRKK
jgi:hypothetical protein